MYYKYACRKYCTVKNILNQFGQTKPNINIVPREHQELAKKISADIKDMKKKVQASIQGDSVRVVGKSRDDLQDVIKAVRAKENEIDAPLQFTNYR